MQIWKYNLDETQTKYLENPMNNFETRSLYWKVRANTIVWQQLQNNLNFTIRPPDGEEERVLIEDNWPNSSETLLYIDCRQQNCKMVARHWIIHLWWFYEIKHYLDDWNIVCEDHMKNITFAVHVQLWNA